MQMATDGSNEANKGPPSFFKVIRYPSAPRLSLPNAFMKKYLDKIPKNPTLRTETGEHSWRLKIVKIGEDYCFTHGWEKLVRDVQLCIWDVIVFWLIDPSTFRVSFMDANGCDKVLPLKNTNDGDNDGNDDEDDIPDKNLCFQTVISEKTHRYSMTLPKKFVDAAGLEYKKTIKVKDFKGKEWIMGIMAERYARTKYSLSAGWSLFRKYHHLSDDDICVFNFNKKHGVINLHQLIKSKKTLKPQNPTMPVNTKPPCQSGGPPPRHGGGGGGGVKIKDEWFPVEKSCGGVKIKIETDSVTEVERKRGMAPPGDGVKVKIEDEVAPAAVERKRVRLAPGGGGGFGEVKVEKETERLVRRKHVVYF